MSKLDQIREIVWLEALSSAALKAAGKRRAALQVEAETSYRTEGATKWAIPEVVQVMLPLSKESVVVTDTNEFTDWVKRRFPGEVVTTVEVRESWKRNLLERVVLVEGDVAVMPGDGEVIPGLGVRPGGTPKAVTIRVEPDAKDVYALHAEEGLKHVALVAGPDVPVVLAEIGQADG